MGSIAGYIDTVVKEWKVDIGDYVVPGDLVCVVTYETYAGPAERKITSDVYGTISEKYYSEGETVPKGNVLWGAELDTRYYMNHFYPLTLLKGESGLGYRLELLCKLSMPDSDKYDKEKWIKELAEWTNNMRDLFQTCKMDKVKTMESLCDGIHDDVFDTEKYYVVKSFNDAIKRGNIKDIPRESELKVGSDRFTKLVHLFADYCGSFWMTIPGEEEESAEAGIRRLYAYVTRKYDS